MKHVGPFDARQRLCPMEMCKGCKENDGCDYLAGGDDSVQGKDIYGTCRGKVTSAQALGTSLETGHMCSDKEVRLFLTKLCKLGLPARHLIREQE